MPAHPFNHGLEAGSKSELMAALAYNENPEALTVLNGYKDEDYIRLALLGRKLGRKFIIVVENISEFGLIVRLAKEMKVQAADRHPGQAGGAGQRPLGRLQRRAGQVRPDLQRDFKRHRPA